MRRVIAPYAIQLQRRLNAILRARGFGRPIRAAQIAIAPIALVRTAPFLRDVERHGRFLAKSNISPEQVSAALEAAADLLDRVLGDAFEPAREQLRLATDLLLSRAYLQTREAEARALFGLYRAELESESGDEMTRRVVRVLTHAFGARAGRIVRLGDDWDPELHRPLYIAKGSRRMRLVLDPAMRGRYACYWSYPLGGAVAQFGFGHKERCAPRDAALLAAAAERCRLYELVRQLDADARRAEEEERRRLGRELHDETAQSLLLLRLRLEMLEAKAGEGLKPALAEARQLTEGAISELRRIIAALSPAMLERLGLEAAIRQLTARFLKLHPCRTRLRISLPEEPVEMAAQEVIYRVAQECFQNIARHSGATRVNLSLTSADMKIRLCVSDNGAGFSAEAATRKPMSFGLQGMKERAALLGGSLTVRSEPRKGTRIGLQLPISLRAA